MNQFFKILFFFFITTLCFAQPSEQQKLEERKAQILKEISENRLRLEAEKKKEKSVLGQINQQTVFCSCAFCGKKETGNLCKCW